MAWGFGGDILAPAATPYTPDISAALTFSRAVSDETPLLFTQSGSFVPAAQGLPPGTFSLFAGHYLFDFYYRIWVVPTSLTAQNPQIDTPIPFNVWNAYPQPDTNTLVTLGVADGAGLVIEGLEDPSFDALEYRTLGVVITADAAGSIDATFTFTFELGSGTFRFLASIANVLALPYEDGIRVEHAWLTDVLQRYNGDEQRLALRERPRRTFNIEIVLTSDADRKLIYDQIYKVATGLAIIPFLQYATPLRQEITLGDTEIWCNTKRADLRVGGFVILIRRDGTNGLAKVSEIYADRVVVDSPFTEEFAVAGTKVMSGISTRLADMSGLSMRAKDGNASLTFTEQAAQDTLLHPLASVTLATHAGLPVLTKQPLADNADEKFSTGLTTIDNETGKVVRFTAWLQKYAQGERSYLINRQFTPEDLDYWFAFLEHCRGQQRSFFASTWREDLVYEGGELSSTVIEVAGNEYPQLYEGTPTYSNLELVTSLGTFWVTVATATVTPGGNTRLELTESIPVDISGATVERVSYLMRWRLGSDKVVVTHRNTHAVLALSLKAV